ncbi:S-adenosyl-L-methionine-dependent methyltransferase [Aspergillus aurantiobrunneus]
MATTAFSNMFQEKDIAKRYELAEKVTGLFARPLINQSGISSYQERPVVFDNACGTGVISSVLHHTLSDQVRKGWKLTCGDFSQAMVDYTQQRAINEGWHNAEVKVVNALETHLPSAYYTHVYAAFAIPLIPDDAMKECFRILQPGGILATTSFKKAAQLAIIISSLEPLSKDLPLPDIEEFENNISKGWNSETHVQSVFEQTGFTDIQVTAVTDHISVPILPFVDMTKSLVPAILSPYWTREQLDQHGSRIPEVMQQWLEQKFADGLVPLEPTVLVATAKKP